MKLVGFRTTTIQLFVFIRTVSVGMMKVVEYGLSIFGRIFPFLSFSMSPRKGSEQIQPHLHNTILLLYDCLNLEIEKLNSLHNTVVQRQGEKSI